MKTSIIFGIAVFFWACSTLFKGMLKVMFGNQLNLLKGSILHTMNSILWNLEIDISFPESLRVNQNNLWLMTYMEQFPSLGIPIHWIRTVSSTRWSRNNMHHCISPCQHWEISRQCSVFMNFVMGSWNLWTHCKVWLIHLNLSCPRMEKLCISFRIEWMRRKAVEPIYGILKSLMISWEVPSL